LLLHQLLRERAERRPEAVALRHGGETVAYGDLAERTEDFARGLAALGLGPTERVAVYLPKRTETVVALFGTAGAGGVFVPVNPLLKAAQVGHILKDCNARVLVTSVDRLPSLAGVLCHCPDLHTAVLVDGVAVADLGHVRPLAWEVVACAGGDTRPHRRIDADLAAILYTSGSTGQPKGVVLSHRNLVTGALSVAEYLENCPEDRLLAVLPFSFDYGLSQLTTAFSVGASVSLMDYLLPRDVVRAVARDRITGLAGVPPLWVQLAPMQWPAEAVESLRYLTSSGGTMPVRITGLLRQALPRTRVYLMYGLTEAFRSTYLPPEELDRRPGSIGKAIPNAEVLVVREDGSPCAPGEPGELVHRGSLVTLGYWNDPERTAERFRPAPGRPQEVPVGEIAVWSGDTVRADEDGFLYFVGRRDEMIKTSGYRVSPTEVEEVLYGSGMVAEAAAVGLPHPQLGQGIVAVVKAAGASFSADALLARCREALPSYLVPLRVVTRDGLPRNPNGKVDRKSLASELAGLFEPEPEIGG
jgi:acyl-CoA ligase (AMP-forming) (exosortase A-associated)